MTAFRGPGVRQIGAVGTTPKEHRLAIAGQYAENAPGVPRSGLLVQAATNVVTPTAATGTLTYSVAPLAAVIARTVGEGVYTPTTTGATTVNTGAAPASGSRWDLIWIKQNDQEKGDADNQAVLGVTQGTAAATPARPTGSVPAGGMVLAEARIFSGTASTTASPNTVTQVVAMTAARGAAIPLRDATDRATITAPYPGMPSIRLDLNGTPVHVWDAARSRWTGPGLLDVRLLTPIGNFAPDPVAAVPAVYVDGGRVYAEGSFTNTTTTTIPVNSTVNLGQIDDSALWPLIAVKQPLLSHGFSDMSASDLGWLQVSVDGKIGIMLAAGRSNPPIGSRHIFIDGLSWRKR